MKLAHPFRAIRAQIRGLSKAQPLLRPPGAVPAGIFSIAAGTFLMAVSINTVLIPYGLLTGGIAGIALIFFYLFKIPVFLSVLMLNMPVFWWGYREINRQFLFYSLLGTLFLTALLPLTSGLLPTPQIDLFLAAIFGGAVNGAGLGLVFRGHGSTGGTDIIAMILRKRRNLGIGEVSFYANLIIIGVSLMFFPLNTGLYTIISMLTVGKITDVVITGLNTNKSVMIVSNNSFQIGDRIIKELHRGVTYFSGIGAFTRKETAILNCVANRFEIARLKSIVEQTDPDAFMYISDANEVSGKGFTKEKSKKR